MGSDWVNGVYVIGSTVYAATNGGLSISTDGGNTFANKTSANGLGDTLVNGVYAVGRTVFAATGSGLSISTDGGDTFANKTTDDGLGSNYAHGVFASDNKVYVATNKGLAVGACQPPPVTATINKRDGGKIDFGNGMNISFPPGAVDGRTDITYQPMLAPINALPNRRVPLRSFTLDARGANGQTITQFAKPFTLKIPYTDEEVQLLGLEETQLNLAYWNGKKWSNVLPCAGCGIDTANNLITVVLDHFTEFALLGNYGSDSPSATPTPTGTPTASSTPTPSPVATSTPTETATPTPTPTASETPASTWTPSATTTGTPTPYARLKLTKQVEQSASRDRLFTFILHVKNQGSIPALNVVIRDALPEGAQFVKFTSKRAQCTETNQVVTCEIPQLDIDKTITVRVLARYTARGERLKNCATVNAASAWKGKPRRACVEFSP